MKKRIFLWLTVCLSSLFFSVSVSAFVGGEDVVVSLAINNPMMQINGVQAEIDAGRGTKPVIVDGRTLVPIRSIVEAFGGDVFWEESTRTVLLQMEEDVIKLSIDSKNAYLNNKKQTLDVAPVILNERTMLPIRFIAEGFNLGVGWDDKTKTVFIVKNALSQEEYQYLCDAVPQYRGEPYTEINGNRPFFKEYEKITGSFEFYSRLDSLGRCDVCIASIGMDLMPTEKRGNISSVIPTGWRNATYDIVEGKYLYNRCHLIGFQLTGENANKRNLITGTRYMNVEGMLPFENMVDAYVEETGNQVMYRATPLFIGDNLVADGVLLEGYSVEDSGKGISFCVYCYNVQPNIFIDYATGVNHLAM